MLQCACTHIHTLNTHTLYTPHSQRRTQRYTYIHTLYTTLIHTLHICTQHYTYTLHICTQGYTYTLHTHIYTAHMHATLHTHTPHSHIPHILCIHRRSHTLHTRTYIHCTQHRIRHMDTSHTESSFLCHNIADSAGALFMFLPEVSSLKQCSK